MDRNSSIICLLAMLATVSTFAIFVYLNILEGALKMNYIMYIAVNVSLTIRALMVAKYTLFVRLLRTRFFIINSKLEEVYQKHNSLVQRVQSPRKTTENLETLRTAYHKLWLLITDLNDAFSLQFLICITHSTIWTIIYGYRFFKYPEMKIASLLSICSPVLEIVNVVHACSSAKNESQSVCKVLYKFHIVDKKSIRKVLYFFCSQISNERITFTAINLFVIDETLLHSVRS